MRIAILIGEVCYNLRSALDYLVFELAKLDSRKEQSKTQFPIVGAREDFAANAKGRWLKGLNDAHVAAIEKLQPYSGRQWTRGLRDASNPDKHRHFVKTKGDFVINVYSEISDDLDRISFALEREEPHPIRGKVKVKIQVSGNVAFDDGTPILETLDKISREVANTLNAFKPEF
jgi:hypothetical protein